MPSGFDWDEGNWPKCAKHGLTKVDVESVFDGSPSIFPARDAADETRRFAVGRNAEGRVHRIHVAGQGWRQLDTADQRALHARERGQEL